MGEGVREVGGGGDGGWGRGWGVVDVSKTHLC